MKFKNQEVSLDGYSFGSKLEASVYQVLKMRQKAGEILSIQPQGHECMTSGKIEYIADFKCTLPNGEFLWIEAKGFANEKWPLKKRLWRHWGPGVLEIWAGTHVRPVLIETIIPKEL